ncbi:hypothetical protein V2O64_12625 [Verrucomicrobiaceae bacterium 227]
MKIRFFSLLAPFAGAFLTSNLSAQDPIGWNYVGTSGVSLAAEDSAGAPGFAQSNWNNHTGSGQGAGTVPFENLVDAAGNSTTLDVTSWTVSTANSWRHGQLDTPDDILMNDFVNKEASLTFSEVPFATDGYAVVVYYGNNEGPTTSTLTVGAVSRTITTGNSDQSSHGSVGYLEESAENTEAPSNYAVFRGNNSESITVAFTGAGNNGISAIQFVPEASDDPPGVPGSPVPPSPSEVSVALDQSFEWSASQRADEYDFYLWPTSEFEPATATATVTTNGYNPPANLLASTQYSWKVVARNSTSGAISMSSVWTFFTSNPGPPSAAVTPLPEDGATMVRPDALLDWADTQGASSYEVYLWPAVGEKPASPSAVVTSSFYRPTTALELGMEYYWTVDVMNSFGSTEAEVDFWTFQTVGVPDSAPSNPDPVDNATGIPVTVRLDWSDVGNAGLYEVRLWPASGVRPEAPTASVSMSFYQVPTVLTGGNEYLWEITALNEFGAMAGPRWRFTAKSGGVPSIGWNFTGTGTGDLAPEQVAGAPGFAQAQWNNHAGLGPEGQSAGDPLTQLLGQDGVATEVSVSWTQSTDNSWFHDQTGTPDELLLNNFADREASVTFEGIDYKSYDVVVYYGNNEGPSTSTLTANSQMRLITTGNTAQSSIAAVGYLEGTDENSETPTNYTVFSGIEGENLIVSLVGENNNGISAIQIIEASVPPVPDGTIVELALTTGRPKLTFLSTAGRTYQIERSTDLEAWNEVGNLITATGESTDYTDISLDLGGAGTSRIFYRTKGAN